MSLSLDTSSVRQASRGASSARRFSDPAPGGGQILLAHGGGGQLTDELIRGLVLPRLGNACLDELLDAATLDSLGRDRPALTIDSYVVQPWQFPGGDIGRLAVCGTVNDLAVCGAEPIALALSLILAEGFARTALETVLDSVAAAAAEAQVRVVTGDTKVVSRGQADGVYITTAGIGRVPVDRQLGPRRVQPGDAVLINGPIADHGLAVMLAREMPQVSSVLQSDSAPLNGIVRLLLGELAGEVVFLRDPTRGGLAGVAADLAAQSGYRVTLWEEAIPLDRSTQHAAEMLGIDPLDVANEGKFVAVVRSPAAERALKLLRGHPLGRQAALIGLVGAEADGLCELRTVIGGRRLLQKPYGEQLPRIC